MSRNAAFLALLIGAMLLSSVEAARVTDGLIVGYDFREGSGDIVGDHSGFGDPVNLTIADPVTWNADGSISVEADTLISSASDPLLPEEGTATKIFEALTATDALTVEAWIRPAFDDQQGPARIVTFSDLTSDLANFTIGQDGLEYQARLRTSETGNKGRPRRIRTFDDAVSEELTHLVYTFDGSSGEAAFWVNAQEREREVGGNFVDGDVGGNFTDPGTNHDGWEDFYTFVLANEDGVADRAFLGDYHLVAVYDRALSPADIAANFQAGQQAPVCCDGAPTRLQAGDADQDLDFDQLDLVKVQISAKYLTGQAATWGEGDWDGAPGGEQGNPPAGNGFFDQLDIISALAPGLYLTGPYAALAGSGVLGDEQTSLVYNAGTGELSVDSPASKDLTSINVTSAGSQFIGDKPVVLDGAFDNFAADNIFKATFGGSFGDISFGNVLPAGLGETAVTADLTAVGSLDGGGDLGAVDLVYIPVPSTMILITLAAACLLGTRQRRALTN